MGRYRDKTKVQCSVCGRWFFPQGLKMHLEKAHNAPSVVSAKAKLLPSLVKPLDVSVTRRYADFSGAVSPCHKAALRDARAVFGIDDSALTNCYLCSQCGEWYYFEMTMDKDKAHAELKQLRVLRNRLSSDRDIWMGLRDLGPSPLKSPEWTK